MPLDHIIKIYKSNTKGHKKPEGQPAVIPTCNKHTGIIQDNQRDSGGRVIRLKGYPTTSHFELSTDPSLRAHTQATHSPAPVSGHASHVTASPPALCPPAATLWTSPLRRHQLNTPDSDAATSIPPPTFTPPSRHPPPTAPTHVPSPPQPPPPPLLTTTHASNVTTSTTRKYRNPPLPPQLPPSPPLPPTTHDSNASAASTLQPSTDPVPPRHQRRRRPTPRAAPPQQHHRPRSRIPPTPSRPTALARPHPNCHRRRRLSPDSTRHVTAALALASHQPRPAELPSTPPPQP
ncbi:hypothetical protein EDB89DRAFT_2231113 [Lactarius sanguifluus]|nr:hypothetical protein EDB89DRAFT_2231113 [Lactarius sanguifluus]